MFKLLNGNVISQIKKGALAYSYNDYLSYTNKQIKENKSM